MPSGNAVVSGTIFTLDDPTLALDNSAVVDFAELRAFLGRARVEIDSGGCALSWAITGADGAFSVSGVRHREGYNFVRVIPEESEIPLVITANNIPGGSVSGLRLPLLTRSALEDAFALLPGSSTLEDDKGHVLVKVVHVGSKTPLAGMTAFGFGGSPTGYDGGGAATGSLGLALFLNLPAPDYPGEDHLVTVRSPSSGGDMIEVTGRALLAKGAVSILLVGMQGV
jgi:hypothetical protein